MLGASLIFTNRFLGPIYRLHMEMRRAVEAVENDANPRPFQLRKNDYFFEIAECYTRLLEKYHFKKLEDPTLNSENSGGGL